MYAFIHHIYKNWDEWLRKPGQQKNCLPLKYLGQFGISYHNSCFSLSSGHACSRSGIRLPHPPYIDMLVVAPGHWQTLFCQQQQSLSGLPANAEG